MSTNFLVVIPTRRRLSTLRWALKTCLDQDYDNFKVAVLVNACPDTAAWLRDRDDPRLLVMESRADLPMTDNWERIFDMEIDPNTFVFFLGDDDGLLPGALACADRLLRNYRTPILNWEKAEYAWPDIIHSAYCNYASLRLDSNIEIRKSEPFLSAAHRLRASYSDGPSIYSSFVRAELLQKIREEAGNRFFRSCSPDVFSSFVLSSAVDRFVRCRFALSVNGASGKSNGISYIHDFTNCSFTGTPIHPAIVHAPSVLIADTDALLNAHEALPRRFARYQFDFEALLTALAQEAQRVGSSQRGMHLATAIEEIARRNGLAAPRVRRVLQEDVVAAERSGPAFGFEAKERRLTIDLSRIGVVNVDDACKVMGMLNPLEQIGNGAPAITERRSLMSHLASLSASILGKGCPSS